MAPFYIGTLQLKQSPTVDKLQASLHRSLCRTLAALDFTHFTRGGLASFAAIWKYFEEFRNCDSSCCQLEIPAEINCVAPHRSHSVTQGHTSQCHRGHTGLIVSQSVSQATQCHTVCHSVSVTQCHTVCHSVTQCVTVSHSVAPHRSCHLITSVGANDIPTPVRFEQEIGDDFVVCHINYSMPITHPSFSDYINSHSVELAWRSVGSKVKLMPVSTWSTSSRMNSTTMPGTSSSTNSSSEANTNGDGLLVQWRLASNQLTSEW